MRIEKSRYIESDETCYCTEKFNVALNLCGVLKVALYFSKKFLKVTIKELAVAEILQPLKKTMVYFLEQKSNL